MYTGYVTFPRVFPVFLVHCISTGINTLVLGGGDAGGESCNQSMMIPWEFLRVTLQIHGYLVAKQDLNNLVWAITIASRKGYLSPIPSSSSSLDI